MEEAMLKRTLISVALVSSFVSPAFASGGVEYTEEDEVKAVASHFAISGEYGTATEAKAMLDRAAAAVKADAATAIAAFNRNDPQFRDRDLFVFCFNAEDGKFTAHEALVGQNVRTIHDKAGKPLGEQIYQHAKEGQINTIAYMAPIPGSTEPASKRAYIMRLGAQICGVSFYRFNGPGVQPTE
jgi:hypothetical protein